MTRDELRKIVKELPKGSREKLRVQFGFRHIGSVNNILSGQKKNDQVVLAAAAIVDENRKSMEEAAKFAQSL